ncbi:hypothetical protein [Microbacterium sp. SORGH_AS_0888]|uniref:hypothetical protein n=1 Tax=Microbacterium sp. SORGH_AS_0888 TaxID=3041791 RepID=UPI0027806852|nr:hypothetical protein [Microbacterium sp. SORGH_AS_0888]MDQ1130904.1 hypothetical protein [Microbacterium sp. SORGH_AS_0888]
MATMNRELWEESEDWRKLVSPENHARFLETIAESKRDGKEVKRVILVGGTPIVYDVSD